MLRLPLVLLGYELLRFGMLRRPMPFPLFFRAEPSTLFAVPSCTGRFAGLLQSFVYPLVLVYLLVPPFHRSLPFMPPFASIPLLFLIRRGRACHGLDAACHSGVVSCLVLLMPVGTWRLHLCLNYTVFFNRLTCHGRLKS